MSKDCSFWQKHKIVHESKINDFKFLMDHNLIKHIGLGYYHAISDFENEFYKAKCKTMNISADIDEKVCSFIKKLNTYNELKDCCESLIGKIAEIRGVRLVEIRKEVHTPE